MAYLSRLELDPRFIEWVRKVLKRRNRDEFEFENKHRELLTKQLASISTKKERLFDMKIDGLFSEDEYQKRKGEILKEEAETREQLQEDRSSAWEQVIDDTLDFSSKVIHLFNNGDAF